MNIELYTDGSATTNETPGGYGWVIVIDGIKHSEGSGHMVNASNNDAELEAAVQGLTKINEVFYQCDDPLCFPTDTVTLVADSQLVLGWASGKYRFRQLNKLDKFKQFQLLINLLEVKTRWVEGHTGHVHNERCDELANEARLSLVKETFSKSKPKTKIRIGAQTEGVMAIWYKDKLKIIDLANNIVEDYNNDIHGNKSSRLEHVDK